MKITKKYIVTGIVATLIYGYSGYKTGGLKKCVKMATAVAGIFMYVGGLMKW